MRRASDTDEQLVHAVVAIRDEHDLGAVGRDRRPACRSTDSASRSARASCPTSNRNDVGVLVGVALGDHQPLAVRRPARDVVAAGHVVAELRRLRRSRPPSRTAGCPPSTRDAIESGDQPSIDLSDSCVVSFFLAPVSRSNSQISSSLVSSDRYAIQRPLGENARPRWRHELVRDLPLFADVGIGRHDEDLAVEVDGRVVAVRADTRSRPGGSATVRKLIRLVLRIEREVDGDPRRRPLADLQRPDLEVVLVRDRRAVRAHRRKLHAVVAYAW